MKSKVVHERIKSKVAFPGVWTLVERFNVICRSMGLKTYEREDLVENGGKHHKFLWVRKVYPATFRSVSLSRNCSIREGVSYKTVHVSYLAWVMSEDPLRRWCR